MKTYVLYHRDSDGRFAGYACWKFLKGNKETTDDSVKFHSVQYNEKFPVPFEELNAGDKIYIVDFSYDRKTLDGVYAIVGEGNLIVLDHHETAERALAGAPYAHYDNTKSGALLAWLHFFPDDFIPVPCTLVNDRDLWQWKYKDTAAFEAWLHFDRVTDKWPVWDRLCTDEAYRNECIEFGGIVVRNNSSIMKSYTNNPSNTREGTLKLAQLAADVDYVVYQGMGILTSELARVMFDKFPKAVISIQWSVKDDDIVFTVRSRDKDYFKACDYTGLFPGGGGHAGAGGFSMSLKEGFDYVLKLMSKEVI